MSTREEMEFTFIYPDTCVNPALYFGKYFRGNQSVPKLESFCKATGYIVTALRFTADTRTEGQSHRISSVTMEYGGPDKENPRIKMTDEIKTTTILRIPLDSQY